MAFGEKAIAHLERKIGGIPMLMLNLAGKAEGEMRINAPWTNHTWNARNGLHAGVEVGDNQFRLYLSHGVDYGVFLELAHGGNYAIVRPTADEYRGKLREAIEDWWRR